MIELNLLPDVKQELIRAQRIRNNVVSFSILISIIAGGLTALLAFYVYGAQTFVKKSNEDAITKEHAALMQTADLSKTVTVKNQVETISEQHKNTTISSRLFDILSTINPSGENAVVYRSIELDVESKTVKIDAEAPNSYKALEALKKTIQATVFEYKQKDSDELQKVNLSQSIADGDRSLAENEGGGRVLRFTITFEYNEMMFARDAVQGRLIAPAKTNVTDSALSVPRSMFTGGTE